MDEEAFSRYKTRSSDQLFLYNRQDKIYYENIFCNAFHESIWFSPSYTHTYTGPSFPIAIIVQFGACSFYRIQFVLVSYQQTRSASMVRKWTVLLIL